MNNKKIINVAEIGGKGWNFVEAHYPKDLEGIEPIDWRYFSADPINVLERKIRKPKIGRYRACIQATRELTSERDIIISHLPRMSHWQSVFMKLMRRRQRHLAFSFNFTHLPGNALRKAMSKSFQRIDTFVVYSSFERALYSEIFDIPQEKIQMLHWAMDTPVGDPTFRAIEGEYYCAVGGEGRDYRTLIESFKSLNALQLVIVTRPGALGGIDIPGNVRVYYNLSTTQFWAVVKGSKAVVVPLESDSTPCGHITLVGSMKLGRPIITSYSKGTTDYIQANATGLVVPPRESRALALAIEQIEQDPQGAKLMGSNSLAFTEEHCHLRHWANFIQRYSRRSVR